MMRVCNHNRSSLPVIVNFWHQQTKQQMNDRGWSFPGVELRTVLSVVCITILANPLRTLAQTTDGDGRAVLRLTDMIGCLGVLIVFVMLLMKSVLLLLAKRKK